MIRVNLAKKKQSSILAEKQPFTIQGFDFEAFRNFPIQKILFPTIILSLATFTLTSYKDEEHKKQETLLLQVQQTMNKKQAELSKFKSYEEVQKNLEQDGVRIRTKLEVIQKLIANRSSPLKLLVSIATIMPKDIWLTEVKSEDNILTIKGSSKDFNEISDLMKGMSESVYLSNVELKSSQQVNDANFGRLVLFELKSIRRDKL